MLEKLKIGNICNIITGKLYDALLIHPTLALRQVDRQLESFDVEVIDQEIKRLRELQSELAKQVSIPLSYMSEFYSLREHISFILNRLQQRRSTLVSDTKS